MQKSYHYIGLLKAVMRLSMTSLKAADAKDVASSITAIANEKLKAEKEAAAGKKKTGKLFLLSFLFSIITSPVLSPLLLLLVAIMSSFAWSGRSGAESTVGITLCSWKVIVKLTNWFLNCICSGGKKKQLHVDKPDDDIVVDTYDALDDYDFM